MIDYLTVPLNSSHNKKDFKCGKELLDNYLHYQAKQDVKRNLTACFILADENHKVKGYYTLSSSGIQREFLTDTIKNKLPVSYHNLPVTLLGRLAVDQSLTRQGIGAMLLLDALKRAYDVSVGNIASMAVIVDPIDEQAVSFYKKYGFVILPDSEKMFLAMKTITELFVKK